MYDTMVLKTTEVAKIGKLFFYLDPAMDGVNQWPMISEGHASARTEFVYNIDEIVNNSAIRYMCTLIECFHIFFKGILTLTE